MHESDVTMHGVGEGDECLRALLIREGMSKLGKTDSSAVITTLAGVPIWNEVSKQYINRYTLIFIISSPQKQYLPHRETFLVLYCRDFIDVFCGMTKDVQ